MNYVLSERSVAWLKRQMARTQGYQPAPAAPSRLVRRDASIPAPKPIYPLLVRFVPSEDPRAEVGEGDFIIYVPAGSVVVNGASLRSEDVPLEPYAVGAYADKPDWYALPQMGDGDSVVVGISYDPDDEENPLLVDIYTGEPEEIDPEDGTVERDIVVARVAVTQATQETPGSVTVSQVTKGPIILECGVEQLNGAMGRLEVVGGKDGVTIADGQKYWIKVDREDGSNQIEVSLTDEPPGGDEDDDDGEDGYCNDISNDGGEDGEGNAISGGGSERSGNDNVISLDPCKTGES